ncbi:MAG TPA: Cof-type HAD-IIB family hydrolase [Candidatus Angelobacter sp.]|nr:Cof-type HAD-IIB family hydrolase [Candidatus Angelobacter sp.]
MNPPVRLIAIDIDGTLLDQHFQVPARNVAALRAAHSCGAEILLATGRRHDYALPIAKELGFPVWLISSNGALIRSTEGETFYLDRLPRPSAIKLIQHMERFRGNAVLTFDRPGHGALVLERVEELNQTIARWIQHNETYIQYIAPLEDALREDDPIQAMYCGKVARMREAQLHLAEANFLDEITIVRTQYDHRDLCILDILNRDCSKGHALRRWAELHQVPRSQIMAIGDNYNDMEMLEFAGVPVIMGNATEEIKQNGWKITGTNAESGVAQALEELFGAGFQAQIQGQ